MAVSVTQNAQQPDKETAALPKESRRERNKREKLNRIVTSARTLFRTKGYEETRTQDIADGADIGAGTLFLYAKSKEDLLVLVFMDEMNELVDEMFQAVPSDQPLLEQTMRVFDGFIEYHNRDFATASKLLREITFLQNPDRQAEVFAIQEKISRGLAELIKVAQQRGDIRADVNPHTAARCIFSTYYTQLLFWLGGFLSEAVFRRELRKLLALVVDGIRVSGADTPAT